MFCISELRNGKNGLQKYVLSSTTIENSVDNSSSHTHQCEIYLFGCTITSWINGGSEKLFLSPTTPFDGVKAIRGGIPIVFPQFGQPSGSTMPQHGFARTSLWRLIVEKTIIGDSFISATFELEPTESIFAVYPYKFSLRYEVTLNTESLTSRLMISNEDSVSFGMQALLHSYIAVPAVDQISLDGYCGCQYLDKLLPSSEGTQKEESALVTIDREVDRIYLHSDSSSTIKVNQSEDLLHILQVSHAAHSSKQHHPNNKIQNDCVLWNPWVDKCRSIADLEDEAYLQYVCVEPGIVSSVYNIVPSETVVLEQCLK